MDHRGSVYRLTNDDGDVVFSAEYNAFGEVLDESNTGATNRYLYQSDWITLKDSGNELVLSPARVYSAKFGRFLQKDMLFQMTLLQQQGSYWNSIFRGRPQSIFSTTNYGLYEAFNENPYSYIDNNGKSSNDAMSGGAKPKTPFGNLTAQMERAGLPVNYINQAIAQGIGLGIGSKDSKPEYRPSSSTIYFPPRFFDNNGNLKSFEDIGDDYNDIAKMMHEFWHAYFHKVISPNKNHVLHSMIESILSQYDFEYKKTQKSEKTRSERVIIIDEAIGNKIEVIIRIRLTIENFIRNFRGRRENIERAKTLIILREDMYEELGGYFNIVYNPVWDWGTFSTQPKELEPFYYDSLSQWIVNILLEGMLGNPTTLHQLFILMGNKVEPWTENLICD